MPPSTGETLTVATFYATQTPASGEPRPSGRPGKLLKRPDRLFGFGHSRFRRSEEYLVASGEWLRTLTYDTLSLDTLQ